MTNDLFICVRTYTFDCSNISWRRKVVKNSIKYKLNTFVFESRSNKYRVEFNIQCTFTDSSFQFRDSDFFTFKVLFHKLFIKLSYSFNQAAAKLFSLLFVLFRDFFRI
eukprot:TRINITY_DN11662_c0_g1_i1.p7 TRINITY_DN11662_c0_g1~~TRINITY_DN11662_c0_g1_i1.p7  ORF type:complete len:108 (-),score=15.67 TRINITY_DN11662_c0_g1_i1:4617-4940(-)